MKRTPHNLSHSIPFTTPMGTLVPFDWFEVLPGDTVQLSTLLMIRVQEMLAPLMHPVVARVHHWFVPYRIIYDDWEKFITGGEDGLDQSVLPYVRPNCKESEIWDYLGIPPGDYTQLPDGKGFKAWPFRAYYAVYNEHYRDQDIIPELQFPKTGDLDSTAYALQNVAWSKDYYSTIRPKPQKGPDVTINVGGSAPVLTNNQIMRWKTADAGGSIIQVQPDGAVGKSAPLPPGPQGAQWDSESGLIADLSQASGITVQALRESLALQRHLERNMTYGSRYPEYLMAHFNVKSSDARLQRPEYLGGGKGMLQFSEVLSTNEDASNKAGKMRGHGIAAARSARFRRFFEEHGCVISCLSIIPKPRYMDTVYRGFLNETKYDFYHRDFEYLGDQQVKNMEVSSQHPNPDDVFGWQSHNDHYRWLPSRVAGEFRSTLDHYHMARKWADPNVALNASFINCVPTTRIYQSTETHALRIDAHQSVQARRLVKRNVQPRTF